MATRAKIGVDVFEAALDRLVSLYADGHRLVYSFSGGKDSGVCLELGIMAATMTNRLPVDVIMRDDEIMYPGTFEYAERVAARPEVAFNWIYACQPVVNTFNRENPFFWVFDPPSSDCERPSLAVACTACSAADRTSPNRTRWGRAHAARSMIGRTLTSGVSSPSRRSTTTTPTTSCIGSACRNHGSGSPHRP
jgi:hypothetical protein